MNLDVMQGALIALVSLGGGVGIQNYNSYKREQRDQRIAFAKDTLLDLQSALGDMALAAEQIRFAKREAGSWSDGQSGLPWTDLLKNAIQASRYSVLLDDEDLQRLTEQTENAFLRLAHAASEVEAKAEEDPARAILRQANARIGERVRGL